MAKVDYFLKLDPKLEGEAGDEKHKGEIEVESFSFGVVNHGTGGTGTGHGGGKSSQQDAMFTKKVDKASATLFKACATGQHYKSALLTVRKAGGKQEEYLKVTLTGAYISSYSLGGSGGEGVVPTDTFAINFAKMAISYKEQKAEGGLGGEIKGSYDWVTNKAE